MKVTKETSLQELAANKKAAMILIDSGMHCVGCVAAQFETLEQGCKAHGMSDKDIEELIEKLNKD